MINNRLKKTLGKRKFAFTLVELMIVVAIIGILAAIAIPAFIKYMRKSKSAEASENIRMITDGEMAYYFKETTTRTGAALGLQFVTTDATPAAVPAGQKSDGDWNTGNWPAIKFGSDSQVYYQYVAESAGSGSNASFSARALGDLDADSTYSTFERVGTVNTSGDPQLSGAMYMLNDME